MFKYYQLLRKRKVNAYAEHYSGEGKHEQQRLIHYFNEINLQSIL